MRNHREEFPIDKMTRVFGVSRSGYYRFLKGVVGKRALERAVLAKNIEDIFEEHKGRYGSPRITDELKDRGYVSSQRRVRSIMKEKNLVPKARKKKKQTTDSNHNKEIAPNLLKDMSVTAPNQAWVSDITYIRTEEGWLYLATILDLFTRKIVGWATSDRMKTELITKALWRAIKDARPSIGVIFHSDRGSQYASKDFKYILKQHGFIQSMSAKGYCYDNAYAESFFHTLKVELIYTEIYQTRTAAHASIFEYIEIYYNKKRKHTGLGNKSPLNFEKEYFKLCA